MVEHALSRLLGGQSVLLLALAALLGVAAAYGAILFRELIGLVNRFSFPGGIGLAQLHAAPWYAIVLPPAVVGLLVGPLVHFLAREARGHGVPEVMDACMNRRGRIRPRVAAVKILASALSIGSGGSVGREGPIVQIGASIGSSTGQLLGLDGDPLRCLVAAGAAGGIAATFNAPIAGALFAIELILGRASARSFSPLVVASVVATAVSRHHLGSTPAFEVASYQLVSGWELPLYAILGVLAALCGVGFTRGLYALEDLWARLPAVPEYLRAALGGAVVGLIALRMPEVMGVGYEHIEQTIRSAPPPSLALALRPAGWLLLLVVAKIVATGTTIGSGGSGGVFAPSLVLGASLGGAFGTLTSALMPAGTQGGPGAYAIVGMGAVNAAATHAPLSAILIVFEMTDRYAIILPLMLSCVLGTVLSIRISRASIYTLKLLRRGCRVAHGNDELMATTRVAALARPVDEPLRPETPLTAIVEQVVDARHSHLHVVDEAGRLLGAVHLDDLAPAIQDADELRTLLVAADLMRPPPGRLHPEDTLDRSLELFAQRGVDELPVVSAEGQLLGQITRADVIALYNREVLRREAMLRFAEGEGGPALGGERVHLPEGHVREEISVGGELAGKSLRELDLGRRFGVTVYAVRAPDGEATLCDAGVALEAGQVLELHGAEASVAQVRALAFRASDGQE